MARHVDVAQDRGAASVDGRRIRERGSRSTRTGAGVWTDLNLNHRRILVHGNRPFVSLEDMSRVLFLGLAGGRQPKTTGSSASARPSIGEPALRSTRPSPRSPGPPDPRRRQTRVRRRSQRAEGLRVRVGCIGRWWFDGRRPLTGATLIRGRRRVAPRSHRGSAGLSHHRSRFHPERRSPAARRFHGRRLKTPARSRCDRRSPT